MNDQARKPCAATVLERLDVDDPRLEALGNLDPYAVARHVHHYARKNGYAPRMGELGVPEHYVRALARNGVLELRPLYEGGPALGVVLTDKGLRMASEPRPLRRGRSPLVERKGGR
jgi:hypothetical protein